MTSSADRGHPVLLEPSRELVSELIAPFEEGRLGIGVELHAHGPAVCRSAAGNEARPYRPS
jgi:hypothetical protein